MMDELKKYKYMILTSDVCIEDYEKGNTYNSLENAVTNEYKLYCDEIDSRNYTEYLAGTSDKHKMAYDEFTQQCECKATRNKPLYKQIKALLTGNIGDWYQGGCPRPWCYFYKDTTINKIISYYAMN